MGVNDDLLPFVLRYLQRVWTKNEAPTMKRDKHESYRNPHLPKQENYSSKGNIFII